MPMLGNNTLPNYTKECGCSIVQLSDGRREGNYKEKKLNGVKTCPKDWSVLLLLVQLKGLQGCKCWEMTPLPPKRWTHSGVLICGKLEAKSGCLQIEVYRREV